MLFDDYQDDEECGRWKMSSLRERKKSIEVNVMARKEGRKKLTLQSKNKNLPLNNLISLSLPFNFHHA